MVIFLVSLLFYCFSLYFINYAITVVLIFSTLPPSTQVSPLLNGNLEVGFLEQAKSSVRNTHIQWVESGVTTSPTGLLGLQPSLSPLLRSLLLGPSFPICQREVIMLPTS